MSPIGFLCSLCSLLLSVIPSRVYRSEASVSRGIIAEQTICQAVCPRSLHCLCVMFVFVDCVKTL
jgi:hypothetical protein